MVPHDEPHRSNSRPHRWQTFKAWHGEALLWREIYTRTAATLAAVFVVYLVALISGLATRQPLFVITGGTVVLSLIAFMVAVVKAIPYWSEVRPLFKTWSGDNPTPEELRAQGLYTNLIFSGFALIASAGFLAAAVVSP